jgi:ribosome biogenesis GTPase
MSDDSPAVDPARLGWDEAWDEAFRAVGSPGAIAARVGRVDLGRATLVGAPDQEFAQLGGFSVATGDWVAVADGAVVAVLPRRSAFVRGDPFEGKATKEQVLAANVDIVLVVQSLSNGPNLRRLERELVLSFDSGATPVIVLTKADIADELQIDEALDQVATVGMGVDVVVTSTVDGRGIDDLRALVRDNRTIAFIGASGVGKSTLVNALVGIDVQETGAVREGDQRGRHTTTARELVLLPGGGTLLDTPGLRAVSLWDADDGLSLAFADIEALAAQCKFRDCSHRSEPGCAVRAAIDAGDLDEARFEHYLRLDAELDAVERKRQGRIMSKAIRNLPPKGMR